MFKRIGVRTPRHGDKLPFVVRRLDRVNYICRLIYDCDGVLKLITDSVGEKRTATDAVDIAILLGIPDRIKTENIVIAGEPNTEKEDDQESF